MEKQQQNSNVKSLGNIVKLDHVLGRLSEYDNGTHKNITKEDFLGVINLGIQQSFTQGFWNSRASDMAVGNWDAGSFRMGRHIKTGKMVEETGEFTDGKNPGKRVKYLDTLMFIKKRLLSEANGYRITPSDENGMYTTSEVADATSSELNEHNLIKDFYWFQKMATYSREHILEVNTAGVITNPDNTGWADKVLEKVVEIEANLMDGYDVSGTINQLKHHPSLSNGEVLVVGTYKIVKKIYSLYLTFKGLGSNNQVDMLKGSGSVSVNGITFTAIPEANMWPDGQNGLNYNGNADGTIGADNYKKPILTITTTGKTAVACARFQSRIYSNEIPLNYGDLVVQSKLLHAVTGDVYTDGSDGQSNLGEYFKDHTYSIVDSGEVVPAPTINAPTSIVRTDATNATFSIVANAYGETASVNTITLTSGTSGTPSPAILVVDGTVTNVAVSGLTDTEAATFEALLTTPGGTVSVDIVIPAN